MYHFFLKRLINPQVPNSKRNIIGIIPFESLSVIAEVKYTAYTSKPNYIKKDKSFFYSYINTAFCSKIRKVLIHNDRIY